MSQFSTARQPLVMNHTSDFDSNCSPTWKLYKRRWWICFLFSALSCMQSWVWITYNVVVEPVKEMYAVDTFWVNFLLALGPIAYIPFIFLSTWALEHPSIGLRRTVLAGAVLCFVGTGIRCFAHGKADGTSVSDSSARLQFWLFVIPGQFLNAAIGPIVMGAPPMISAVWFGANERTLATAITSLANTLGATVGFLCGLWVHTAEEVLWMVYLQTSITALIAVLTLVVFPDHPPSPPSTTSATRDEAKTPFVRGMLICLRNRSFLTVAIVGGLASGFFNAWLGLLDANLQPMHFSQDLAGWLGFAASLGAILMGIIVGKAADSFAKKFKLFIVIMFVLATLSFAWFSACAEGWILVDADDDHRITFSTLEQHPKTESVWMLFLSGVLASTFISGALPLFYEMCAELIYPIPESVAGGALTLVNNVAALIFIGVADFLKPALVNWAMAASCVVFAACIALSHEEHRRSKLDQHAF